MKIYLAARYSRHAEMRGYRDELRKLDHTVTSRWIDQYGGNALESRILEQLNSSPQDYAAYAIHDCEDLSSADLVISFTSVDGGGKGGRHIEFGLALGLGKRLIIVGPRENIFHTLPNVTVCKDFREALNIL